MFCHLGHFFFLFFWSWRVCYLKGRSLTCSMGRGNAGRCTVRLYVGEGPRGSNGACSTLHWTSILHSATHNQTGPLWCWFPSGWACAYSRPLWVSPTTSPMRLGVSPAAASTPTGIFNQRFEVLFPCAGALGCVICFSPPLFIPVYLCANVGPRGATRSTACLVLHHSESGPLSLSVHECRAAGSASGQTASPFVPHSANLGPATATRDLSAPVPVSARPTCLDVCFFFIYLVSYFLAVRFSVSSGCARRRRVSTYTAILVLCVYAFLKYIYI